MVASSPEGRRAPHRIGCRIWQLANAWLLNELYASTPVTNFDGCHRYEARMRVPELFSLPFKAIDAACAVSARIA